MTTVIVPEKRAPLARRVALCVLLAMGVTAGAAMAADDFNVGPAPSCITPATPCITIPVTISRTSIANVRGISVHVQLSPNLQLCAGPSSIIEGSYLSGIGSTLFQVIDNGGGDYTVDCAILGLPCGATAAGGTLFTLAVQKAPGPDGTGSVTLGSAQMRDCVNSALAVGAGPALSVSIDTAAPGAIAALTAAQQTSANDADGTTKVVVSWPAVEVGATVEVYRAGYGNYPEYDDAPGAGSIPATPSYPPGAPWALAGTLNGPNALTDESTARDVYYYVAFVRDACGNQGPASNQTGGTLNYHLGDVSDGVTNCAGNNLVNTADISLLGANYGASLAPLSPFACVDVGPTSTNFVDGRPLTDNLINFEDLLMFAINYGSVSAPQDAPLRASAATSNQIALAIPTLPGVGGTFRVGLPMRAAGDIQGVSAELTYDAAIVEPVGVWAGELLSRQGAGSAVLSSRPGSVDVALLGPGQGLAGEGVLAEVEFRVRAGGDAKLALGTLVARDARNQTVLLGSTPAAAGAPLPARSQLGIPSPNPFAANTSIQMSIARSGSVKLAVFDLTGRRVRQLLDGHASAGERTVQWDGRADNGARVPVGYYVLKLETGGRLHSRSLIVLK